MRKIISVLIVIGIVSFLIYNSKRNDYKNDINFYNTDINAQILKIVESRGTKVYYSKKNFFYLESYKGVDLMKGDSIVKKNKSITVYRRNKKNNFYFLGKGYPLKPPSSYFKYFFF